MDDELAFLACIREKPEDRARWLVYTDWLRDRGRDDEAEMLHKYDTDPYGCSGKFVRTYLFGRTLEKCYVVDDDEVHFVTTDGDHYKLYHQGDCCESVTLNDVAGDLNDLVGSPLLMAEETVSRDNPDGVPAPEYQDSFTWTFYRFATVKGYVTLRWYGESNGYYSESVDFAEVSKKKD